VDQDTFQIKNCDFAYSFGVVAAVGHEKLGALHAEDSVIVAANIKSTLAGKKPTKKASNKGRSMLLVTWGEGDGRSFISGFPILGGWITRSAKSRDLSVSYAWGLFAKGLHPRTYKWE